MSGVVRVVGNYEILARVGGGGAGVVWRARHRFLPREVALKQLRVFIDPESEGEAELRARFLQEARILSALAHPNIVTVYDYFVDGETEYIAMEYLRRGALRALLRAPGLSDVQALGVLDGVLQALEAANLKGIVHRDIKPENLLVADDGSIKVADFGIAKALDGSASLTVLGGSQWGTPAYMSPEQAGGRPVGRWTDLYATGVVGYELLAGRLPFGAPGDTPLSLLRRHEDEPLPAPRAARPDLDPRLEEWLCWMLRKDPAERPADAAEARRKLEAIAVDVVGPGWREGSRLLALGDAPQHETDGFTTVNKYPRGPGSGGAAGSPHRVDPGGRVETPPQGGRAGTTQDDPRSGRQDENPTSPRRAALPAPPLPPHPRLSRRVIALACGVVALGAAALAAAILTRGNGLPETCRHPITVGPAPKAVVAGADAVWVANFGQDLTTSGSLTRIDPGSCKPTRVAVPVTDSRPVALALDGERLWVLLDRQPNPALLVALDPRSGKRISTPVEVGTKPRGLAARNGSVWVTSDNSLWWLPRPMDQTATQKVLGVIAAPRGVTVTAGAVWIADGDANRVREFKEPESPDASLEPIDSIAAGTNPYAVAIEGMRRVWVAVRGRKESAGEVITIDAHTAEPTTIALPSGSRPIGIAVGAGSAWIADSGRGVLAQLDLTSGEPTGIEVATPDPPQAVTYRAGVFWATTWDPSHPAGTVIRIDPGQVPSADGTS